MTNTTVPLPEAIECPLCLGKGELSRSEVLERLGMKDFARVAQLSAEEAIRLLVAKEKDGEQARWAKFDAELARRLAEATGNHSAELQKLRTEKEELVVRLEEYRKNASATLENAKQQERLAAERELQEQAAAMTRRIAELEAAQKFAEEQRKAEVARACAELEAALSGEKARANDLARQGKDYLQEIGGLRERNRELEAETAKVSRVGKREEIDFAEEARSWPGIWVGEKLPRNGDYLMAFADAAGNALEPAMVVDNKDKAVVAQSDVRKLVRDAKQRNMAVACNPATRCPERTCFRAHPCRRRHAADERHPLRERLRPGRLRRPGQGAGCNRPPGPIAKGVIHEEAHCRCEEGK